MASHGESFVARGIVREGGEGAAGKWVEAFDLDRLDRADRLGEARSDSEGAFSITYRKATFARSLAEAMTKPGPDLIITVRDEDGALRHMTLPRPSASRQESFEIHLNDTAPSGGQEVDPHRSDSHRFALADPLGYWSGKLGLGATSIHALRRDVRRLQAWTDRLEPGERRGLEGFLSLSTVFPPRVATALAACGAAGLAELREWPAVRFRNALAVAGVPEREIDGEVPRFERLRALWPQDRPEDPVTGIDIDLRDRSALSRSDWAELRRADIATVDDWLSQREQVVLSPEGRAALDVRGRLMVLGVPPADIDRFWESGLTGARSLAGLDAEEAAELSATLGIESADLDLLVARARSRLAAIEERIVRIVRESETGIPAWIADAAEIDLLPPTDAFPDSEPTERFGYLSYLRHLSRRSGAALDNRLPEDVLNGRVERALEPVARVVVWNEALERARGEALDHEGAFAARWRRLEGRLLIGRLSPFDLAAGDVNLELRLRAGLVAPFAPSSSQFSATEMAVLEGRADRAARRRLERLVVADAEFAEGTAEEIEAEVQRRMAQRMEAADLEAETLNYAAFRNLDPRSDADLRRECLIDTSLPATETTTRLDEAVVAMTILLEVEGAGERPLPFLEWRRRRARLLWPHAEGLRQEVSITAIPAANEGLLAEAVRHVGEAESLQRGEPEIELDAAKVWHAAALVRQVAEELGPTPEVRLLRGKLGKLLLRRADALCRSGLAEARAKAAESCRMILALHQDPEIADRLGLAETPAALGAVLGYAATRARREGDLASLIRRVEKVLAARTAAHLSGASAAEIHADCRPAVPVRGGVPRENSLEDLIRCLRSMTRPARWPRRSIQERYDELIDQGEIRLPIAPGSVAQEGIGRPMSGCSPLELLLAAPLPSRDPVADHQKLAALSKLEEIRNGASADWTRHQPGEHVPHDHRAVRIVRDATLQLSRCAMFVRRFDQLSSAGAALHERSVGATWRLAAEAGMSIPMEQVPFETRAEEWAEIVAAAPECISSASAVLRRGLELQTLATIRVLADRATAADLDARQTGASQAQEVVAEGVPAFVGAAAEPAAPSHLLDGPWRLTKTLSLARLMPADFQAFREGAAVLAFRTSGRWFEGEFARLCDRRIEGVGIAMTVAGRRPSVVGVRLWNSGIALGESGPGREERLLWRRPALANLSARLRSPTSPRLESDIDRASFAGGDAQSDWVIEISDATEPVDPAAILDIELTIEYRAYGEYGQTWGAVPGARRTMRERIFSLRSHFPDAWADFEKGEAGQFSMTRRDFAPGLEDLAIAQISLHLPVRDEETPPPAMIQLGLIAGSGGEAAAGGIAAATDGIASTRQRGSDGDHPWAPLLGRSPIGEWQAQLQGFETGAAGGLPEDLLVAITYVGVPRLRQD